MSENTPQSGPDDYPQGGTGPTPTPEEQGPIDLNKTISDLQEKANVTINVAQEKAKDPQVQRIAKTAFSVGVSLGLTYWAAKRGTRAGMKNHTRVVSEMVNAAGDYAQIAEENARVSHEAVLTLTAVSKAAAKSARRA